MNSRQLVKFALCFNGLKSINVAIKRTVKIGKLSGLSPFPNPIFIHLGNVLQPSTSFEFNNIRNGDTIFACPSSKHSTHSLDDNHSWKQLTDTIDYISRKQCQDDKLNLERLRLNDLYLAKLDCYRKPYHFLTNFFPKEEENKIELGQDQVLPPPSTPSTSALPKIW